MKRFSVIFTATGHSHGDFDTWDEAANLILAYKIKYPDLRFHIFDLEKAFS